MKPTYEELEHIACEMSQQDWSDLRFADVYYDAFVAGGKWFMQSYEELERERNELAAQVERLRCALKNIAQYDKPESSETATDFGRDFDKGQRIAGMMGLARHALSETTPAALAALKAQWQAEARSEPLEECKTARHEQEWTAYEMPTMSVIGLRRHADEIHQRAQEAGDDCNYD